MLVDLAELARLTTDRHGAQRVCWTDGWERARRWLRAKLAELPVEVEVDAAGNLWATLEGESRDSVVMGSHLDSVPGGGWLDGALGVVAGLEVLRHQTTRASRAATLRLVDWADEEGGRFAYSLFGSSAATRTLDVDALLQATDADGVPMRDALRDYGVDLETATEAHHQLRSATAYLELHIEQGPVLEAAGVPVGVVTGALGVEERRVDFSSDGEGDPVVAAFRLCLHAREEARKADAVATVGLVNARGTTPLGAPLSATLFLDQRHTRSDVLQAMVGRAHRFSTDCAAAVGLKVRWSALWSSPPVAFDADLVELAEKAVAREAGSAFRLVSGGLHDATVMSSSGIPTAMLFVQSIGGVSHSRSEDSHPEHIAIGVRAMARLVADMMRRPGAMS